MSNYSKTTDFASKDALATGNANKIVKGTEIDDEFNAIQTAIATKANTLSPTLTGTPLSPTAASGTNTTQIATTAFVTAADNTLEATLQAAIDLKADINSPTFTGDPTAPTPSTGDNDTSIATTAFVQNQINAARGFIAFDGSTATTIASENLTLTKNGTGDYTINCDSSIRDGTSNWAITIGNVDQGVLSQAPLDPDNTTGPDSDDDLTLYNCFVNSRAVDSFNIRAIKTYNKYRIFSAADTDGNATQMFGITAVDPTYICVTLF
jgi:hypothetical protein